MRPRRLVGPTAIVALVLAIGCGGHLGAPPQAASKRGAATMTVKWPARDRTIPNAANSLVVTLKQGSTVVATQTLARPAGGTSNASFSNLPFATLDVSVAAFPTTDGTGVAQATGASTLVVTQNPAANVATVNLGSTVSKLLLYPGVASVAVGGTLRLTASARDDADEIVLLSAPAGGQETIAWSVASGGVTVTPVGTGLAADVAGTAQGAASVKATFGAISATLPVTVTPAAPTFRPAGLAHGGWPVDGGDYGYTGQGKGRGAAGTVAWTKNVGGGAILTHLVGPDGVVYAQSSTLLAALDPSGNVLWQNAASAQCDGMALTDAGLLLVSAGRTLQGIDARTGSVAWTFTPASTLVSGPSVGRDGTIYVDAGSMLYAVNPTTGTSVWSQSATLTRRFAIGDDGTLYASDGPNKVNAFDPKSGAILWSASITGDTVTQDVVVSGGKVYVESWAWSRNGTRSIAEGLPESDTDAGMEPHSIAMNNGSGTSTIGNTHTTTTGTTHTISTTGTTRTTGTTGVTGGTTQYTYYNFVSVTALDAATGSVAWTYHFPTTSVTSTSSSLPTTDNTGIPSVAADGHVLAATPASVASIDAATGAQRWLVGATSLVPLPVIAGDGAIYLATASSLITLNPADGTTRWSTSMPSNASYFRRLAVADDGSITVGTPDGNVVKLK